MWRLVYRSMESYNIIVFFFSSSRRHTRSKRDWSSDVCSSDLAQAGKAPPPSATPAAPMLLNSGGGRAIGLEGDPNFSKLPSRDRELHLWAIAQTRDQAALQHNHEVSMECTGQADAIAKEHPQPLGDNPLVDVSTDM